MMHRLALIILICTTLQSFASAADAPKAWFADITQQSWLQQGIGQFVGNPLYGDPTRCLGAPAGGEVYAPAHSTSTGYFVSLGDRDAAHTKAWVIVGFSTPIEDNPRNPYGLDFIVFSNAYFMLSPNEATPLYGDPTYRWQEPAFVEISQDALNWYLIRPNILPDELIPSPGPDPNNPVCDTGFSGTPLSGYAEYTPSIHLPSGGRDPFGSVHRTAEEQYTVPDRPSLPDAFNSVRFDYVSGGGDAFDIADAVVEERSGVPAYDAQGQEIKANIGWFKYVRLTDAVSGDYFPGLGEISAEIDAASAVRPAITIGEAKKLAEGGYALITDAIVTAVLPDSFFIESPDRSAAMKVIYDTSVPVDGHSVTVGDKMTVTGHLSKSSGRFVLPDPMWTCTAPNSTVPKPLGMSGRTVATDAAYGMSVRIWGKVTDKGADSCLINDGSSSAKLVWSDDTYSLPDGTTFVSATGTCDKEDDGTTVVRSTSPQTDIRPY